jgi:hypothetical protein
MKMNEKKIAQMIAVTPFRYWLPLAAVAAAILTAFSQKE